MTGARSDFLHVLTERGYLHQATDMEGLDEAALAGRLTAYVGYDCTGPSLHVGHLLSIMMLRLFQRTGHKPIVLMGGGTTKVGDPSGKDETRQLLTEGQIAANMDSIKAKFANFVTFGNRPGDAVMANNAEWLDELGYIQLLRDVGRHFSVNRMLTFDSVRMRLEREQPLTFLEFNYMILQAYDFLELYRRLGCRLQMGGSDQWGNIVNGIELTRRIEDAQLFGLTCPLITTASGAKMGKTAQGAVWLNADALSPYDYWQFWRNTEDGDVGRFLKLFTELPMDEIARLEALQGAELNEAKKILANEATTLCHGRAAAEQAARTAAETFEAGAASAGLPVIEVERADLEAGIPAFQLFARAGLAASNSAARKLIQGGGARINDRAVAGEMEAIGLDSLGAEGAIKLSAGRKRHILVRPAG